MKIIIHLIYRFDIGGLEKVMADTINSLPDYSHIIIVLTEENNESKKLLKRNVEIIELHKKEGKDLKIWGKLLKVFISINANVLHSYNLSTLEYQFLGFLARIPVRIHAEHGRDASDPEGKNKKYRLLRKLVNPFIHYWVAVSDDLSNWLESYVSIPKNKIKLIYNGIDTDFYRPFKRNENSIRLENFSSNQNIVLGTIGRLDPVKNQKILIDTFNLLVNQRPELKNIIKIAIIGSGPLKNKLLQEIQLQRLEDKIWLPGARYNIIELLNSIDIFLLPSIAEGIPMTILEAMSMQKPVIASEVGGIPEILKNNTGITVKPNDANQLCKAILSQLDDFEKSIKMGKKAREHVIKYFSLDTMIQQYNKLYSGN